MIASDIFSKEDLEQIKEHGLSFEAVLRQLEQLNRPTPYLHLVRPCKIGDGIEKINPQDQQRYIEIFEQEVQKGRFLKFVPASGAATRMFRVLQRYLNRGEELSFETLAGLAEQGDKDSKEFLEFIRGLKNLGFYYELCRVMREKGYDIEKLYETGRFRDIVRFILGPEGLHYADTPKALVLFHRYNGKARTALEEHLVEAAHYVADASGRTPLHFTVADEHMEKFRSFLDAAIPRYEKQIGVKYHVELSVQKKSTDTIAIDLEGRPFRLANGRLLFRPAGHGALIENLNDLHADIIFIKNIDNVVPDHLKPETYKWKKILGGMLVSLQTRIHGYLGNLEKASLSHAEQEEILNFLKNELRANLPDKFDTLDRHTKRNFLLKLLNRPIRVCGMVRNVGEPGGGPFWVKDKDGQVSRQIVEVAQIDPSSEEQQAILRASTHFNPVDLACGVRDWQGNPFDLRQFVDPDAVFISKKSKDGRDLKALELPGLWNGAMARWITFFVEVPLITFNPVKTVNALLRAEHQPA
ncbi:MAG: DUF4301 domain-containing protein [Deltaproteobacteria bacterium]|nr:MAG: DUF4301 domain-containing protein [Deltaproteobacteria bacterium]